MIKKWCNENNVVCTILRLPLVVGSDPPGNLGAMIQGIKHGYYFNVGGGTARKSMVLANDVAKFVLRAANVGGIYNLTDSIHPSFNQLSKFISSQFGKSFVPNIPNFLAFGLAKFGDILGYISPLNTKKLNKIRSTLTFDDTKAKEMFGWEPISVLEGFQLNKN